MRKRVLSALMAVCLMLTLLPVSAFAAGNEGEVTATKTWEQVDGEKSNTFEITLSVQGNPITTTTESAADVVLVVDNSGSMASSVGTPCGAPKESFEEDTTDIWIVDWTIYTCPDCGARYYAVNALGGWIPLYDDIPDVCTGEVGEEPRITTAQNVGKKFAESILGDGSQNTMAVIGFSHNDQWGGAYDDDAISVKQGLTKNLADIKNAIDDMEAVGGEHISRDFREFLAVVPAVV